MVMVFGRNKKRFSSPGNGKGNMEMEEYQTRIELLSEIAEEASSVTEVATLLERILKVTQHSLGTTVTTLFLNDEKKNELHSPFSVRNYEGAPHRRVTAVEMDVARWVASNVEPVLVSNAATDSRFNEEESAAAGSAVRSIIAAPVLRGEKVIGVISSIDKDDGSDFTERDFEVLKGFATTEALILLVSMQITAIDNFSQLALDQALLEGYRSTDEELAATADIRDSFGYAHSRRCKEYALLIANCLGLPSKEAKAIEFGALLHDIGKIGIDSDILCKPGPLTDEEWKLMYEHPRKGANVIGDIPYLKEARNIVLYHHERYDGKGYPEKLKGEEIPLGARIVAVANAFDSMTTDRAHRPALNVDEAINELIDGIGTQFCPQAVEAFVSAFRKREDQLTFQRNHEDLKAMVDERVEEITSPVPGDDLNITIEEEREAKKQNVQAEKEAREQQARSEKEAEKQRIKAEKEARKQQAQAEKEAKEQKAQAEKEAKEQKAQAEKEAKEQKAQAEKEAKEQKARAEKEAKEQQAQAKKEAKEQKAQAEKEDKKQQARSEKEAEKQRIKAEKEARKQQAQAKKEAKEQKAQAEKEAKKQQARSEKEAEKQRIKAEKEARKQQAQAEKEAKEQKAQAEKEAKEQKAQAEKEAKKQQAEAENEVNTPPAKAEKEEEKQSAKDEKVADKQSAEAKKETGKDRKSETAPATASASTELFHGNVRLTVPVTSDAVEVRRFRKELEKIKDLKIVMTGSSEEDGHLFVFSLEEPVALMGAVGKISAVESIAKKGKNILVTLKNGNS
jgi:HD-GYP domain-containing protein (c-di-GMP phosphodiesterase class II)